MRPGKYYVGQAEYTIEAPRTPKIIVRSQPDTERMRPYNVPWACISITGPTSADARFPVGNCVGVLRLKFDDVNGPRDYWYRREDVLFNDEMARRVLAFAKEVWPKIEVAHVHCWAGISRSSATAAALSRIYFGSDGEFVCGPVYRPNSLVYRTILDVHTAELATAKLTRQQEVLK